MVRSVAWFGLGVLCLGTACGDDSSGGEHAAGGVEGSAASGGSTQNGGSTSTGATASGGAPAAGASSTTGAGGTTAGGTTGGDSGASVSALAFGGGGPVALLEDTVAASLTITEDELELFFVHVLSDGRSLVKVFERSSKGAAFGEEPRDVAELQMACAATDYPSLDVSNDGLRMYFTCLDGRSPLRLATRASRDASWVVGDDPLGTVADSIGVSDDELSAVAVTGLTTPEGADWMPRPVLYQRSSLDEPFGEGTAVTIDQNFMNPDLACGDRTLFGAVNIDGRSRIASSKPGSSPGSYSTPSVERMPVSQDNTADDYTPTVTPDCRRMYFLRAVPVNGRPQYTIHLAERN